MQEAENDGLDILADIAGFGDGRRIRDAEGNVEDAASVRASSVLPEPVGPMSRMLLFSISTSEAALSEISVFERLACPARMRL